MSGGYNLEAGRDPEQVRKMQELIELGLCAFCRENLEEHHINPIEIETDHWVVTRNDWPYTGSLLHLLLISKAHVRSVSELPDTAQLDLMKLLSQIEKRYQLRSYAFGMRLGEIYGNGGSVDHLHAHVVVGNPDSDEPVRFKMSSVHKTEEAPQ